MTGLFGEKSEGICLAYCDTKGGDTGFEGGGWGVDGCPGTSTAINKL